MYVYVCMYNDISWDWDPRLNMKLIYISYMPDTHSLKKILYTCIFIVTGHMRLGVKFPSYKVMQRSKSFII